MSSRPTAVLVAPGRGAYTARESGALARHDGRAALRDAANSWISAFDAQREEAKLTSLRKLDRSPFKAATHLLGVNASSLIFAASCLDALALEDRFEVVAVAGNSLGWYTALGIADALPVEDTHLLIQTMALLQRHLRGGQILYPCVDETSWRTDPALRNEVARTLREIRAELGDDALSISIELGGYVVLCGSEKGLKAASEKLPKLERGPRTFPLRLALHGPFHGPLMQEVVGPAHEALARLRWSAPRLPLIDGEGRIWSPWSADPRGIARYTLGRQLVDTFDYSACVRVALREFNPDHVVLLGPGNPLGGPTAQVMIREGWRGLRAREDFERVQAEPERPLISYGLEEERARLERG